MLKLPCGSGSDRSCASSRRPLRDGAEIGGLHADIDQIVTARRNAQSRSCSLSCSRGSVGMNAHSSGSGAVAPRLRGSEKHVVAAAGMHGVEQHRFAVRRQRVTRQTRPSSPPASMSSAVRRALAKPHRINQLHQRTPAVSRRRDAGKPQASGYRRRGGAQPLPSAKDRGGQIHRWSQLRIPGRKSQTAAPTPLHSTAIRQRDSLRGLSGLGTE